MFKAFSVLLMLLSSCAIRHPISTNWRSSLPDFQVAEVFQTNTHYWICFLHNDISRANDYRATLKFRPLRAGSFRLDIAGENFSLSKPVSAGKQKDFSFDLPKTAPHRIQVSVWIEEGGEWLFSRKYDFGKCWKK